MGSNIGWGKIVLVAAGVSTVMSVPGISYFGSLVWKDLKGKIVIESAAAAEAAVSEKLKLIETNTNKLIEEQDRKIREQDQKREQDQQEIRQLLEGIKQQQMQQ